MTSPAYRPWDIGLQNERTGLAWQRTLLAGLTCSLLVARLLASVSFTVAAVLGLLGMLGTAALGWVAVTRFRFHDTAVRAGRPIGDGRPNLLLSGVTVITALGALVYVLVV